MVARLWKLTALFLIPILHQTTTFFMKSRSSVSCSSFQFYIKPQPFPGSRLVALVVPHSNSTSNHNYGGGYLLSDKLFLIPILHQTTTFRQKIATGDKLFLIPILHQTTTISLSENSVLPLFLIPILHQTTTSILNTFAYFQLFLIPILHQTTTYCLGILDRGELFLIPILHQTTTSRMAVIHILHVTHMTPMHKTSCRTPGKLVGCNFVFQRAIYQKNSSC